MMVNLWAAWLAILAGVIAGAVQGLFFKSDTWLGGYASWPRRMTRLGHISFFGIAFINLAFLFTAAILAKEPSKLAAYALVSANALMPAVCYASAWKKNASQFFVLPVACVMYGVVSLILTVLM